MAFDNFVSPPLPIPPKDYNFDYFNQLIRVLTSYLRIQDSRAAMNTSVFTCDMLRTPVQDITLTESIINSFSVPLGSFIRINNSASDTVTINGISNGSDGRILTLFNASPNTTLVVANDSSDSVVSDRVITCTGSNVTLNGYGVVNLMYSVKDARWVVISVNT